MNVILLDQKEHLIKILNNNQFKIEETISKDNADKITVEYYSTSTEEEKDFFKIGNKIFIYTETEGNKKKGKLYVINTKIQVDYFANHTIKFNAEEVLIELANARNILRTEIKDETGKKVSNLNLTTKSKIRHYFNQIFSDYYALPESDDLIELPAHHTIIPLQASQNRLKLLREIEKQTKNTFRTNYYLIDTNVIHREVHFIRKENVGTERKVLLDFNYNLDDIEYVKDESKVFTGAAPSIDSEELTISEENLLLNSWNDLTVKKGQNMPVNFEKINNEPYPTSNESDATATNFWRRTPKDPTYSLHPAPLKHGGVIDPADVADSLNSKTFAKNNKGKIFKPKQTAIYTYVNKNGTKNATVDVEEDDVSQPDTYFVGVGKGFLPVNIKEMHFIQSVDKTTARFSKQKNHTYITNNNNKLIDYQTIRARPDLDTIPRGVDPETEEDEMGVVLLSEEEEEEGEGEPEEDTYYSYHTPKIMDVNTKGLTAIEIYDELSRELEKHLIAEEKIEAKAENVNSQMDKIFKKNIQLYDKFFVKLPDGNIKKTYVSGIKKAINENNQNYISLEPVELITHSEKRDAHFDIPNISGYLNSQTTFKGYLYEYVEVEEGDYIKIQKVPIANRIVNVKIISPEVVTSTSTTERIHKKKKKKPKKKRRRRRGRKAKPKFWKFGLDPDKKYVFSIAKSRLGKTKGKWIKLLAKNKCPSCEKEKLAFYYQKSKKVKNPYNKKTVTLPDSPRHGLIYCHSCKKSWSIDTFNDFLYKKTSNRNAAKSLKNNSLKIKESDLLKTTTVEKTHKAVEKYRNLQTNSKGYFSMKHKLTKYKRSYTVEFKFLGDATYNEATYETSFYVKKNKPKAKAKGRRGKAYTVPHKKGVWYSTAVTKTIQNKALSIVKGKKGLSAAKALANWVHNNIKYKRYNNFKWSPSKVLSEGLGNCCGKTELFLQMCEAVGVMEDHDCYFYHVPGHVYAKIDNTLVDVTCKKNPWGHYIKRYGKTPVKKKGVTKYPSLPFERSY